MILYFISTFDTLLMILYFISTFLYNCSESDRSAVEVKAYSIWQVKYTRICVLQFNFSGFLVTPGTIAMQYWSCSEVSVFGYQLTWSVHMLPAYHEVQPLCT